MLRMAPCFSAPQFLRPNKEPERLFIPNRTISVACQFKLVFQFVVADGNDLLSSKKVWIGWLNAYGFARPGISMHYAGQEYSFDTGARNCVK